MKDLFTILFLIGFTTLSISQTKTGHLDLPSSSTLPFLWDLEQDTEGDLYVCSEIGEVFKKSDDQWGVFDLDLPTSDNDVRSIAIDDNGIIFILWNYSTKNRDQKDLRNF